MWASTEDPSVPPLCVVTFFFFFPPLSSVLLSSTNAISSFLATTKKSQGIMHTSSLPLAKVQSVNTIKGRRSPHAALVIAITKSKQKGEHSCGRKWRKAVCPTNWLWKMLIHLLHQPITPGWISIRESKASVYRWRGKSAFRPLNVNSHQPHQPTAGVDHVENRKKIKNKTNQEMPHVWPLIDIRSLTTATYRPARGEKQPFISAGMDFTIHCPLLIKESRALLKVNDSAPLTASYVLQMMRLLIGL